MGRKILAAFKPGLFHQTGEALPFVLVVDRDDAPAIKLRLPSGPGSRLFTVYSRYFGPSSDAPISCWALSIHWPKPDFLRWIKAHTTPNAPVTPPMKSGCCVRGSAVAVLALG